MSTTAINKQDLDKIKEWLDDPNNQIPSGISDILKRFTCVLEGHEKSDRISFDTPAQ